MLCVGIEVCIRQYYERTYPKFHMGAAVNYWGKNGKVFYAS